MKLSLIAPIGATFSLVLAMPAVAQDSGAVDWTGPYVGVSFGKTWQKKDGGEHLRFDTDADGSYDDVVRTTTGANAFSPGTCGGAARGPTPASGCDGDKNAIGWMGHVGYDKQFGSLVVGAVLEGGKAFIDDKVTEYSTTPAFYTMRRKIDWNANGRLRLGYTTPGGIMPYITGGVSYAQVQNYFRTSNTANSFTPVNAEEKAWGYNMGGGIEAKVSDHFSIGARYLWTRYNTGDYRVDVGAGSAPATNPFRITPSGGASINRGDKFETQSVMVTTSYRF
ncbi:outer membrane protein [Sphingobium sp.]|uniref:outer membrane protein n=1 Tax=Sphingobium sp. TaxID=1912891 RepID=UPI003B3ADC92